METALLRSDGLTPSAVYWVTSRTVEGVCDALPATVSEHEQKKGDTRMDSPKVTREALATASEADANATASGRVQGSHTPGPWVLVASDGRRRIEAPSAPFQPTLMCDETYYPWCPDSDADWHLIAAAPDMLAALRGLHDDIAEYARINHIGGFDNHWMRAAREAIEKATNHA